MKIRQGFVSNSSSSSFIVNRIHDNGTIEALINIEIDWGSEDDVEATVKLLAKKLAPDINLKYKWDDC